MIKMREEKKRKDKENPAFDSKMKQVIQRRQEKKRKKRTKIFFDLNDDSDSYSMGKDSNGEDNQNDSNGNP